MSCVSGRLRWWTDRSGWSQHQSSNLRAPMYLRRRANSFPILATAATLGPCMCAEDPADNAALLLEVLRNVLTEGWIDAADRIQCGFESGTPRKATAWAPNARPEVARFDSRIGLVQKLLTCRIVRSYPCGNRQGTNHPFDDCATLPEAGSDNARGEYDEGEPA